MIVVRSDLTLSQCISLKSLSLRSNFFLHCGAYHGESCSCVLYRVYTECPPVVDHIRILGEDWN